MHRHAQSSTAAARVRVAAVHHQNNIMKAVLLMCSPGSGASQYSDREEIREEISAAVSRLTPTHDISYSKFDISTRMICISYKYHAGIRLDRNVGAVWKTTSGTISI